MDRSQASSILVAHPTRRSRESKKRELAAERRHLSSCWWSSIAFPKREPRADRVRSTARRPARSWPRCFVMRLASQLGCLPSERGSILLRSATCLRPRWPAGFQVRWRGFDSFRVRHGDVAQRESARFAPELWVFDSPHLHHRPCLLGSALLGKEVVRVRFPTGALRAWRSFHGEALGLYPRCAVRFRR